MKNKERYEIRQHFQVIRRYCHGRYFPQKKTLFAKKVTIDLDEQHLIILDKRLKMAGYHGCMRGVIWEALELLADKYNLQNND
ncbi:hypothetical protein AAAX65_10875 [Alistipes finegoldii]|uniref:hypothetical protein n=1 Tax=Alistipes finegoldii TaxID=214856 RepID=UPI0032BFE48D